MVLTFFKIILLVNKKNKNNWESLKTKTLISLLIKVIEYYMMLPIHTELLMNY